MLNILRRARALVDRGRRDGVARRSPVAEALERRLCLAGQFVISDASVVEGDAGARAIVFTVTWQNPGALQTAVVQFATADGTATAADNDYEPATGVLTFTSTLFPVNVTRQISVGVNGDTTFEPNETFQVELRNASNATIADGVGVGTIVNDEREFVWDGRPDGGGPNVNQRWSTPSNWIGDIAPTPGAALRFPAGATRFDPTNDFAAGTAFGPITITANGYAIGGTTIALVGGINAIMPSGASALVGAGLQLAGERIVTVTNPGTSLVLSAAVGGAGGLAKAGVGTLEFSGGAANTYTGATRVDDGTLLLTKAFGFNAVPGALVVGDGAGAAGSAVVRLGAANQVADGAAVTVNSDGLLDLAGRAETVASLAVGPGGRVNTGAATLTVNGTLSIAGGDGNDRLVVTPAGANAGSYSLNGAAPVNFAGITSLVFEGGAGTDIVEVNGGNGAETFTATANGTRVRFDRVSPAPFAIDIGTSENLVVNANGGDDTFSATGNLAALVRITVDGGSGNDTLLGSNGADTFVGGDGNDFVDGNQGNDVALLGAGDDTFQWDPGDGSDVVEGQAGADTMRFNGANIAELFDASANGGRVRFLRNVGNITMDLNDVESIDLNVLGGADTVTVNDLSGTDLVEVNANLAAVGGAGDGQPDVVIVNGTAGADAITVEGGATGVSVAGLAARVSVTGAEAASDGLRVDGLAGADVVNAALAAGFIRVTLAGGVDNDTLVGSQGADILLGGDGNDTMTGGDGDDQVFGDAGNDRVVWNPGDDTDLNEGGDGTDTVEVNGGNGAEAFTATANGTRVRFDRVNPAPFAIDIGTSENLVLNANGGDDTFSATGNLAALIHITVDGGAGNDTILGSNGADVLLGGDGNDFVDGQQGNDVALLGAGDDTLQWDPGDGNDVVEGQAGADRMLFNGANIGELFDASANGGRVRFFRNVANIVMDLNDVETIDLNALGGADGLTVNDLSGTDLVELNVNLAATGGAGDAAVDTVIINGTAGADAVSVAGGAAGATVTGLAARVTVSGADAAGDQLSVNGLDGNDHFTVTPADGMTINVDGGTPRPPASPGDVLTVRTAGTALPTLAVTDTPDGRQGAFTFADRRPVQFANVERVEEDRGAAVRVTRVFVNGTGLTGGTPGAGQAAFRAAAGIDAAFGYPVPAGAAQLRSLPWLNGINQVSLRFDRDVADQVALADLVVRGVATANHTFSGFAYDVGTRTATWTLGAPVTQDKLRLVLDDAGIAGLDGEWTNGVNAFPSGDGSSGGDFNFRINVLRGDVTGEGAVNALDLADVRRRLSRRPGDGVSGAGAYSVFSDINMDGVINALDLAAARQRLGRNLPAGEPAATALLFLS